MKYRVLGKTGLQVSEIGFGAWGIGDFGFWGQSNEDDSFKALLKAYELGVNFYDTARVYADNNNGRSEKLIGRLIKEVGRENLIIASKVHPKNWRWPAIEGVPISEVFTNEHIVQDVEDSLKCLGTDYLDLMQFHVWQDYFVENDEWKVVIKKLTAQGKVKHWGLSLNDYQPENCQRTIETGLIESVQLIFNIFHQKPVGMFPFFKKHNVGVIARVPLDEGGLSGSIRPETIFPSGDFRSRFFGGGRQKELIEHTRKLESFLGEETQTLPELALRFILSFDEVSTTIPGMRKEDHVVSNTCVSDGRKLSADLLSELRNQAWERNFYS